MKINVEPTQFLNTQSDLILSRNGPKIVSGIKTITITKQQ